MSFEIADSRLPVSRKFELIKDSLLQHDDLLQQENHRKLILLQQQRDARSLSRTTCHEILARAVLVLQTLPPSVAHDAATRATAALQLRMSTHGTLAYNLVHFKMLQSAAIGERMPRSLSITATPQRNKLLAVNWLLACVVGSIELINLALKTRLSQTVVIA